MKYESIEAILQLHERIEIIYVVDGYEAEFSDCDGIRILFSAKGQTIEEAMDKLDVMAKYWKERV